MRKIQRQIFESKTSSPSVHFSGKDAMKEQQVSDFLVKIFSDVPYKSPLEAYGMRGSFNTGCVEAGIREFAHLSHHCTMHAPNSEIFTLLCLLKGA